MNPTAPLASRWTSRVTAISCQPMSPDQLLRSSQRPMKSVLYLGCPPQERTETEKMLGTADVAVVWADNVASALGELQRRDMPVLLDLSRGAAALQSAREIRTHRASTTIF